MENRVASNRIDTHHVDVLDGIRALSVLMVVWFHLWQQSWLRPTVSLPFLEQLGMKGEINLEFLPRAGYLFVDMLLLISAFCLFLPHARAMVEGERAPDWRTFYKKRLVRIVPSYMLSVFLIFFAVSLPTGGYVNGVEMWRDLLSTVTFTQTFFPAVLLGSKINGVLWTAAIEMQFYLIFPVLALCFRKKPIWTYLGMVSVSMCYLWLFALPDTEGLRVTLNQLPGFFAVFANGMLAAYAFVLLGNRIKRGAWLSWLSGAVVVLCLVMMMRMLRRAPYVNPVQVWQAKNRFSMSMVFAVFVLSSALSARWYRAVLGNAVMRFLAAISYNLYIWHQWLFVKLKEWRIPFWSGDTPPNFTGDTAWQIAYTVICLAAAFGAAVLATHLVERPIAARFRRMRHI